MSATQYDERSSSSGRQKPSTYKRVVLEGPVRNRQDGTFYIGADENSNLIDPSAAHVKANYEVPTPKPVEDFHFGDICRTALGSIVLYDSKVNEYPWVVVSTKVLDEPIGSRFHVATHPLTLLVRNGKVVCK